MSFELSVRSQKHFPRDLKSLWESWLAGLGVIVEIYPSFEPSTWAGGFLPMKVSTIPDAMIGTPLRPPALSGFEVSFNEQLADFRSAMGRTSTEFALLCLCAAGLARISEGLLLDGQAGASLSGDRALIHAQDEIRKYVRSSRERDLRQYPFTEWK